MRGMSRVVVPAVVLACWAGNVLADRAEPLASTARMPIREVTVFKDGHAFVVQQGSMPTDAGGRVVLDALPTPVLGTFWTYSPDKEARLLSVSANQRKVMVERTAITVKDLIEANVGADVMVTEAPPAGSAQVPPLRYSARVLSRPTISGEELEATSPPNGGPKLPVKGEVVLLRTEEGTKAVALERILDVTFKGEPRAKLATEEFRNLLTLQFAAPKDKPAAAAARQMDVGMAYVQKGIRWIPSYKVTLTESKQAAVQLQATLINELADLSDVTANLVVGVPSFAYAEALDPISLQQAAVQLSQYFQQGQHLQLSNNFSNAVMTQVAGRMAERVGDAGGGQQAGPPDLGPELAGSAKAEDLFIYTLSHITLPKGGRMVVPVTEFTVPAEDVYTLDIPFTPPLPIARTFDTQQRELARLAAAPKVQHKVRLTNTSRFPLTTAPALVFAGERVLAQTTMTYTPPGSEVDLGVTTAVDVRVKKSDTEVNRVANAAQWNGDKLMRVELEGKVTLTSYAKEPIEVRVTRHVLGKVGEAQQDGRAEMANVLEDDSAAFDRPEWLSWHAWPDWWTRFNGVGRITWTTRLEPGKATDLTYGWSYYWR